MATYGADKLTSSKWGKFWLLTLKVKVNHPQNYRDLNQGLLHLWSKFGDPSLNESQVIAQRSKWLTHGHTQTQAMTIPKDQNWPRVKMGNKVFRLEFSHDICLFLCIAICHHILPNVKKARFIQSPMMRVVALNYRCGDILFTNEYSAYVWLKIYFTVGYNVFLISLKMQNSVQCIVTGLFISINLDIKHFHVWCLILEHSSIMKIGRLPTVLHKKY